MWRRSDRGKSRTPDEGSSTTRPAGTREEQGQELLVSLSAQLASRLSGFASIQDRTVSEVLADALAQYLDEHEGDGQPTHVHTSAVQNVQGLKLYGASSKARRASAQLLVTVAEKRGQAPDRWAVEVAAGRIVT